MLKDYKGRPPIAQGEDFDASPANIEKRTTRGELANGLKFALLPKKTRGEAVSATLTLRFGTLGALADRRSRPSCTASMLDKGTQHRSRQQIKDTLDRLKARVSIGGRRVFGHRRHRDRSRASRGDAAARARAAARAGLSGR